MDFKKFKKVFDESFGKVTPDEFIKKMKKLGYKFKSVKDKTKLSCPDCKSTNVFFYKTGSGDLMGQCKDCFIEWD